MYFVLAILILLVLGDDAQDVPRVEPLRPLRPAPCEDEQRARWPREGFGLPTRGRNQPE